MTTDHPTYRSRTDKVKAIVRLADSVSALAKEALESLKHRDDCFSDQERRDRQATYKLVCGTRLQGKKPAAELFWNGILASIAHECRGLALWDDSPLAVLRTFAFTAGTGKAKDKATPSQDEQFWEYEKGTNPARAWFLVAYFEKLRDEADRRKVLKSLSRKLQKQAEAAVGTISGLESMERFLRLREVATYQMVRRHELALTDGHQTTNDNAIAEALFNELQRLLAPGNENARAVEISVILRVLAGRHLNLESAVKPRWRETFSEAIAYVLDRQNKPDGSWDRELILTARSPLLHPFSPLHHLLDLDLETLQPHLDRLAEGTSRAMRTLKLQLELLVGQLSSRRSTPISDGQWQNALHDVIAGMSLGSITKDRFKDLLSEAILDRLGATYDPRPPDWNRVPESLGFQANIREGVIRSWEDSDPRRPGAILIFGPPGTGKTGIAEVITAALNERCTSTSRDTRWRFLSLSPANFARQGSDRVVARAERIFKQLTYARRCVVLLDEMEEFMGSRGPSADKETRLITTAFLPLLQEAVKSREIILVLATNYVGHIDPAITRRGRFDLILPLGPPDESARVRIISQNKEFAKWCAKSMADNEVIRRLFALYTMGYVWQELQDFIREFVVLGKDLANVKRARSCHQVVERLLWQLRSENVPTALSGRTGCNWRVFQDETSRFARFAPGVQLPDNKEYWIEPVLPDGRAVSRIEAEAQPEKGDGKKRSMILLNPKARVSSDPFLTVMNA